MDSFLTNGARHFAALLTVVALNKMTNIVGVVTELLLNVFTHPMEYSYFPFHLTACRWYPEVQYHHIVQFPTLLSFLSQNA